MKIKTKYDEFESDYLSIVFQDRNQSFGAYQLRKGYLTRYLKSFGIALIILMAILFLPLLVDKLFGTNSKLLKVVEVGGSHFEQVSLKNTKTEEHKEKKAFVKELKIPVIKEEILEDTSSSKEKTETSSKENEKNEGNPTNGSGNGIGNNIGNGKDEIDIMPSFPGGYDRMTAFIQSEVKNPLKDDLRTKFSGNVSIGCLVEKSGHLKDCEVIRGIHPKLDHEALRIVKEMPDWIPAMRSGQAVDNVFIKINITFR